jgi:hypothetical protein
MANDLIWQVELQAPAINEVVVTSAASEQQAIERAVYSAVQRMLKEGQAVATVIPAPPGATLRDQVPG